MSERALPVRLAPAILKERESVAAEICHAESTNADSPSSSHASSCLSGSLEAPPRAPAPETAPLPQERRGELTLVSLGQKCTIPAESYQSMIAEFLQLCGLPRSLGSVPLLLFRTLVFLRQCGYDGEDILTVLAHASAYLPSMSKRGRAAKPEEIGSDLVLLIFLAHSYVLDKACPLCHWSKSLFTKDCSMQALNLRIMDLSAARGYVLRVDAEVLAGRLRALRAVSLRRASSRRKSSHAGDPQKESGSNSTESCCVPWRVVLRRQR